MSSKIHQVTIAGLLVSLAIFNFWIGFGFSAKHVIEDQAAAVSGPEDQYISLLDIITASLDRLKQRAAESPASSTPSETSVADSGEETQFTPPIDLAEAIVNIYCVHETSKYRRSVSGTGFMVSRRGAILTNAHVAQFMLLSDKEAPGEVDCQVRTGRQADAAYVAGLLYISPSFVTENVDLFSNGDPRGTGENDFALLYIIGTTDGKPAPTNFPFIPPSTDTLGVEMSDRTVIVVGYPSAEDSPIEKQTRQIATTTITELYTFDSGLLDLFSLSASELGYQGASGGPVIDHLGRSIGVISTKRAGTTMLNAITTGYIDRRMRTETGFDLASILQGDPAHRARLFNETMVPILKKLLTPDL